MSTNIFVYDAQSGLCTWFFRWASQRTTIRFVADSDLTERGVDPAEYARHAVLVTDAVYRGFEAIAHTLRKVGGFWAIVGNVLMMPGVSPCAARIYSLVARYRTRSIVRTDSTVAHDNAPAPR